MNWAWSQLQLATAMEAASRGDFHGFEPQVSSKRPCSESDELTDTTSPRDDTSTANTLLDSNTIMDFPFPTPVSLPQHTPNMQPMGHQGHGAVPSLFSHVPSSQRQQMPQNIYNMQPSFDVLPEDNQVPDLGLPDLGFPFPNSLPVSEPMSYGFPTSISPSTASAITSLDPCSSDFNFHVSSKSADMLGTPVGSIVSNAGSNHSDSADERTVTKRRRTEASWESKMRPSMSPFAADQTMMRLCTRGIISSSLLQVYHDVLEHNLSCWLTEATCPYQGAKSQEEGRRLAEWGPSWSNRIFDRTVRLEDNAKKNGLVRVTKVQDQAATRAMHMAVMAFATQWAQGSRRKNERYQPKDRRATSEVQPDDAFAEMADEFDRNLQRHFWNEAQKALNNVTDVESYRVICAEVIMGFAQKPWTQEDIQTSVEETQKAFESDSSFNMSNLLTEISRCIDMDGPPIHLERAARKMHTLKLRHDSLARASAKKQGLQQSEIFSMRDQSTLGLLYWLTVMADTISSSMTDRPNVVKDEDSQHDATANTNIAEGRWNVDLFIKDEVDNPKRKLTWPCTYEEAAEAVTVSGPTKILMYRHVGYLQSMVRRFQGGPKLEEIISSTLRLWEYWKTTYGRFYRQLIDNFAAVPVRIRSWFFCICAHWHLACLLAMEQIDYVDEDHLGVPAQRKDRISRNVTETMKEISVCELSDLARISLPPSETTEDPMSTFSDPGFHPDSEPDFHHAVNEGTILTEPWTIILVRAFSRAAVVMLRDIDNARQYGLPMISDKHWDWLRRSEDCTKTLFYLGKKSDMARRVADVLSEAISALRESLQQGSTQSKGVPDYKLFAGRTDFPGMAPMSTV